MYRIYLLLALLLTNGVSPCQQSSNLTLAGRVSVASGMNDLWGWVGPNNAEYAICGVISGGPNAVGEIIVDVTNPTNPVVVQTLPGESSFWRDIKTWGNYAYVVNESDSGLRIIDLSGLPGSVQYKDTVIAGILTAHNIQIDNGYLYICGSYSPTGGLEILDLSDPWRPAFVGYYNQNFFHDVYVRNNLAYTCHLGSSIRVLDVTNKANPVLIATYSLGYPSSHNAWQNAAGNVLFVSNESAGAAIEALDITNLGNIQKLGEIRSSLTTPQNNYPHNTTCHNDFLINSCYNEGVQIVDAAHPDNLIEVGYYDTTPFTGPSVAGCWGVYPFLPSGTILATDIDSGLFILQANYVRACYLEGEVTDAQTTNVISGATIEIQGTSTSTSSSTFGLYTTGLAQGGTFNVKYSKPGYQDSIIPTTFQSGQLIVQDVALQRNNTATLIVNVIEEGTGNPIPNALVQLTSANNVPYYNYTANGAGVVSDSNILSTNYDIYAGKWGYRTKSVSVASTTNISLTIELARGYYDDFALDFNWTVTGNATSGIWERCEPIGTVGSTFGQSNPQYDFNGDISDQCYVTGNGGGTAGNDDVDGGNTILTTPQMDLSNYTTPVLRYQRWFANGDGGGFPNDTLRVEVNNGFQTVVLKRIYGPSSNYWIRDTFLLANYLPITGSMTVRFDCGDYGTPHVVEGGLDVFEVYDLAATASGDQLNSGNVELTVSPNPLQQTVRVTYDLGTEVQVEGAIFEVHDLCGRLLHRQVLHQEYGTFTLDLDLSKGVYLGSLKANGQVLKTFRMLK